MKFNSYNLKQRFGIRKYHVGVCSVLLGMTLLGVGTTVSADEVTATSSADKTEVVSSNSSTESVDADTSTIASSDTTGSSSGSTTTDSSASVGTSVTPASNSLDVVSSSEPSDGTEDISTKNLGFTVVQKTETDNRIESGSSITNLLTLTTTDPLSLSGDSYLKQIIRIDSTHNLPVASSDTYLTDNVTRADSSTAENDSEIVSISKLSLGEVSSGTIRSYISNAKFFNLSNGQNLSITYELVDNAKVLARKTLKYAVQEVKPVYDTAKTSSEYLTTYNAHQELLKTLPLEVTTKVKNDSETTYQWGTVEYTVPTGFKISDDDKSRGITQEGNKVTVKFKVSGSIDATQIPSEYANAVSWGDTVHFDTSSFGTYSELRAGKDYTITRKVTMYNETGTSDVQNSTITGTLRTPDVGDGVGEGEGSATTNNEKLFKDNVLAPSKQLIRLYVGEAESSYNGGKLLPYGDGLVYSFDKLDTLKNYSLTLNSVYPISPTNVSDVESNATFDVYSVDTGAKLGSITMKSRAGSGVDGGYVNTSTVTIPDNTKAIKFVPTGSINTFGASTYRGLATSWYLTPTDKSGLIERYDAKGGLSSSASVTLSNASPISTDVTYTKEESTVKTYVQWSSTTVGSASSTGDKVIGDQQWEVDIINKDKKVSTDGISSVTSSKANLILNIPEELSVTIKGKTYGKGLHSISMNDVEYRNQGTKVFVVKVNASRNAPDGEYELQWAIDWSNASEETRLALKGDSPMSGILESTKNSQKFTIINLLQLGSQTSIENKDGSSYTSTKDDVEPNTNFHIKQTVYNTLKNAVQDVQAITYLPRKGFEGSTYSVTLNEAIASPTNWSVQYATDTPTGDRDADMTNLNWSSSVSDYSKVTAIKYVQTSGTLDTNARVPFTMSVKTTDTLAVSDVAKIDVAIKSPSIPITVRSKSAEMTPLSYTERWQDTKGVDLKDPVKTISEPALTTADTFENYDHIDDTRLSRITTHVYKLQDKADVTVVHKLADGTVLSTKKVVNQGKVGTAYTTTAEVPATKKVVTESGSDLVTTVTTYTTTTPSNAVGKVTLGGTTVTYVYTPKETSSTTPKEVKVSEAVVASTMTYVPDSSLDYNTSVVDVPNKDGKTVTIAVSKIVGGNIVTTNETRTEVDKVDGRTRVGNVKTEVTGIDFSTKYQPSGELVGQPNKTVTEGTNGSTTVVTTYTVNSSTGALENGVPVTTTVDAKDKVVSVANIKVTTTDIDFETVYEYDSTLAPNTIKETQAGVKGVSTKTDTYNVNPATGELTTVASTNTDVKDPVRRVVKYNNIVVTTEEIPFETVTRTDSSVESMTAKVLTQGEVGSRRTTITYTLDKATGSLKEGTPVVEVTKEKVDKVVVYNPSGSRETQVPYGTKYVKDTSLDLGQKVTRQAGVTGLSTESITDATLDMTDPNNPKVINPIYSAPVTVTEKQDEVIAVGAKPKVEVVKSPYETVYKEDSTLDASKQVVEVEGSEGVSTTTTTYTVDSTDGSVTPDAPTTETVQPVTRVIRVGTKSVVEKTPIPFDTIKVSVADLPDGKERVKQEGVMGEIVKTTTYAVNPKTGEVTSSTATSTVPKQDKVIEYGTATPQAPKVVTEVSPAPIKYEFDESKSAGSEETTEGKDGNRKTTIHYTVDDHGNQVAGTPVVEETPSVPTIVRKGTKATVETTVIPHTVTYVPDETLEVGKTVIDVKGKDGKSTKTTTYTGNPSTGEVTPNEPTTVTEDAITEVIRVGIKPKVTSELISHTKEFRDNPNLPEGVTRVVQVGKDGSTTTTITYTVDLKTGKVTPNAPTTETINPVDEVVEVGTKKAVTPTPEAPKSETPKVDSSVVETTSSVQAKGVDEPRTLSRVESRHELPNTGDSSNKAVGLLGLATLGLGLVGFRKRKNDEG